MSVEKPGHAWLAAYSLHEMVDPPGMGAPASRYPEIAVAPGTYDGDD
jgi:hypothetical protein